MFLLYDTETTGLLTTFDQITEFAAIICDDDWNVLEQHAIDIRLTRDTVPALEALAVTPKIPSLYEGMLESDALAWMHRLLQRSPWNGGYNTLRFDDEMLRFGFYRQGLYPYQHQNPKVAKRFDLLPMVVLFYLIHQDKISWPLREDGRVSLKLEHLNQANQWCMGKSHTALFDVEVTVALMRLMAFIDRKLMDFALGYSDKTVDAARTEKYKNYEQGHAWAYLLDPRFASQGYVIPCYYQGVHPYYANQTVWSSAVEEGKIIRKKWGEPPWVLPERIVSYLKDMAVRQPYVAMSVDEPRVVPAMHAEADLYANQAWMASLQGRRRTLLHRWRYQGVDLTSEERLAIAPYQTFLHTGAPSPGGDHLGRERRTFADIDADALAQAPGDVQALYEGIQERIGD